MKREGGKSTCQVIVNGEPQEREIVTGPSNEKMVMVVSGLSAGDEVVIDEKGS